MLAWRVCVKWQCRSKDRCRRVLKLPRNDNGVNPPLAFCSHVKGTVGVPKGSVSVAGPKRGESGSGVHVQDWVFTGISADVTDMAVRTAAKNGGLRRIDYADYELTSILGFVTVFNLVAYGE